MVRVFPMLSDSMLAASHFPPPPFFSMKSPPLFHPQSFNIKTKGVGKIVFYGFPAVIAGGIREWGEVVVFEGGKGGWDGLGLVAPLLPPLPTQ